MDSSHNLDQCESNLICNSNLASPSSEPGTLQLPGHCSHSPLGSYVDIQTDKHTHVHTYSDKVGGVAVAALADSSDD